MTPCEKKRFCQHCQKHVHDFSAMTREAAAEVVRSRNGSLCVRIVRNRGGTLVFSSSNFRFFTFVRWLQLLAGLAAVLYFGNAGAEDSAAQMYTYDSASEDSAYQSFFDAVEFQIYGLPGVILMLGLFVAAIVCSILYSAKISLALLALAVLVFIARCWMATQYFVGYIPLE